MTAIHERVETVHHSLASRKLAAGAAALFGIALFMTVAVVNVPHDASDAELLQWWQSSSNRTTGVLSGFFAIAAAALLPVVLNHVVHPSARGWAAFARSMGAAVTAVWLVTGAARAAVGHLVDVMNEPLPGVDVLRFATALNYTLLGISGMAVIGLCALGVSIAVLRSGQLARWAGRLGVVCSVIMLAAVVAQFGAFATPVAILWSFGLAVAIWRQPEA